MARRSLAARAADRLGRALFSRPWRESHDLTGTVLLCGSGRSGTTWIEGVINHAGDHRILFEPFHPEKVPEVAHFVNRQYLRPDADDPRYLEPARAILEGRVGGRWIDAMNRKVLVRRRVVKDIRANLLLPWIHRHFPQVPIVFLVRHPCAVASSRRKLNWGDHRSDLLGQPDLVEDWLAPHVELLESLTDPFEIHVATWCVENLVPLRGLGSERMHLASYERFCCEPEAEALRLFTYLRRPATPRLMRALERPSALARSESAVHTGASMTEEWRAHVSEAEEARALELVEAFGLTELLTT